jgi:hypothetical protein
MTAATRNELPCTTSLAARTSTRQMLRDLNYAALIGAADTEGALES